MYTLVGNRRKIFNLKWEALSHFGRQIWPDGQTMAICIFPLITKFEYSDFFANLLKVVFRRIV